MHIPNYDQLVTMTPEEYRQYIIPHQTLQERIRENKRLYEEEIEHERFEL